MPVPTWLILYEFIIKLDRFSDLTNESAKKEYWFLEIRLFRLVFAYYLRKFTWLFESDFKKFNNKSNEVEKFFRQSIIREAEQFYQVHLTRDFYLKNELSASGLMNFVREKFKSILIYYKMDKKVLSKIIQIERLRFLAQETSLEGFLRENEKYFRIILIYYSRDLRIQNNSQWEDQFRIFCDYIEMNNLKESTKPVLGVLVDYDLHEYLKSKLDFYGKSIKIEYYTSEIKQLGSSVLNLSSQNRIALNDIKASRTSNRLDLTNNNLTVIDKYSWSLLPDGLIAIDLKENCLFFIQSNTFDKFSLLEYLDLSSNYLKEIPGGLFRRLKILNYLDLSKNQLNKIEEGTFEELENLEELNLSSNNLNFIQANEGLFKNLKNLVVLNLEENRINLVEGLQTSPFEGMYFLKQINLANNYIQRLESGLFRDLINLEILVLSSNRINFIEKECFFEMKKLKFLSLNQNRIQCVLKGTFESLPGLRILLLHSNKIRFVEKMAFNGIISSKQEIFEDKTNNNNKIKAELRLVSLFENSLDSCKKLFDSKVFSRLKYLLDKYDSKLIKKIYRSSEFEEFKFLLKNELYLKIKNQAF